MKKTILLSLVTLTLASCNQYQNWFFEKELQLNNVHAIGITTVNNQIWLSDGNGNRLVSINEQGELINEIKNFERPMHISAFEGNLLIPEYGRDTISILKPSFKKTSLITPKLDAPAGIHQWKKEIAIADFYNHRILYKSKNKWIIIGEKGSHNGQFNYPTDVQITENNIYVADAYNHRVQVFSKTGKHLQTIGADFNINAATGIYVTDSKLYITDFENNRVIITDLKGKKLQTLEENIEKPTDILVIKNQLWILNFKKSSISLYKR